MFLVDFCDDLPGKIVLVMLELGLMVRLELGLGYTNTLVCALCSNTRAQCTCMYSNLSNVSKVPSILNMLDLPASKRSLKLLQMQ